MYDIIIIGSGASGAAAARELSRYQAKICVLEKEEDVCCGTSKANSAIVHAGYDAAPGSLKAKLNVCGNERMGRLAEELDIPFQRIGSLVLCFQEADLPRLQALYERGQANGVLDLRILDREEALNMEPNLSKETYAALYAPTAGIICPFELNLALAENARANGVEFKFLTEVKEIKKLAEGYELCTTQGSFRARYVVNASGLYGDELHNMVSCKKIHLEPRCGDYCLLDREAGSHVTRTIFPLPDERGKGILVTPTVHGNLLIGPTAIWTEDKEGTNTTSEGLGMVLERAGKSVRNLPVKQIITSFAGLRAHEQGDDFIIEEVEDARGFIDCIGIESPGIASTPAIGEMIAKLLQDKMGLKEKENFISTRKGITNPGTLSMEERNALIKKQPAYGNIICRCEMISEGEILDAIRRPLGAKSLDGIKRRTRAGMGRCQSGFCAPRVMEILARELNIDRKDVTKSGGNSQMIAGMNKDML
ncbi:NAD(P)/FAD-dependent oxidoreductase [Candidatus Merdisoma sp. JLR.KK006]|uniref:NAD(P)/FAD-dependent oxidoreductase n=1 Tax=Candidatus Merdisoma sp. JLR.KK006 TaxID=3112626 RepID=UPI002FF14189